MATVFGRDCKLTVVSSAEPVKLRWICDACDWAMPFWMPVGAFEKPAVCGTCRQPMVLFRPVDLADLDLPKKTLEGRG